MGRSRVPTSEGGSGDCRVVTADRYGGVKPSLLVTGCGATVRDDSSFPVGPAGPGRTLGVCSWWIMATTALKKIMCRTGEMLGTGRGTANALRNTLLPKSGEASEPRRPLLRWEAAIRTPSLEPCKGLPTGTGHVLVSAGVDVGRGPGVQG
ncbi:hypothetical protein NDU88_008598 [Pleurodeles waltl]|uniref:Uncharacterized protein n=1 Tax=Pleurodeles waltl TaxID=8319 RepID=A0AAV7QS93_PLEWA|nr:hypothetical protein NDU88_008598 [Pleurodeles waltl]